MDDGEREIREAAFSAAQRSSVPDEGKNDKRFLRTIAVVEEVAVALLRVLRGGESVPAVPPYEVTEREYGEWLDRGPGPHDKVTWTVGFEHGWASASAIAAAREVGR